MNSASPRSDFSLSDPFISEIKTPPGNRYLAGFSVRRSVMALIRFVFSRPVNGKRHGNAIARG